MHVTIGQSHLENPSLKLSLQLRLVYVKLTINLAIGAHVLDCC